MPLDNFYEILNVNKNSEQQEIKKAFRSLSFKHHPDKNNGDDTHFKKITEAYNIVGDPSKRRQYDMEQNMPNGEDIFNIFFNSGNQQHTRGFTNIFTNTFPSENPFEGIFKRMNSLKPLVHTVNITLEELYSNEDKKTTIIKNITKNNITSTIHEEITVNMPNQNTMKRVYKNKGHELETHRGDLIIKYNILPHDKFILKNNDIYYSHDITLKDALCGFSFILNYLDNKTYKINNTDNIIYPNYKKKINKLGLNKSGDLYIVFSIKFPTELSNENKGILKEIL